MTMVYNEIKVNPEEYEVIEEDIEIYLNFLKEVIKN